MRNQRHIIIFFAFVAALTLGASTTLAAGEVACENEFGECKVGQDFESCSCKGGANVGSTGGVDTGGDGSGPEKSKEELMAECKELLADMCGGKPLPPKGTVTCKNKYGKCNVGQEGYSCNCIDGPADGGGTGGGTGEPGEPKSQEELMEECQEMLADMCGGDPLPPKGKVTCKNEDGECTVGQNFHTCSCKGGAGTGGGGGASDTGGDDGPEKSQEELMAECKETLTDMCGDDPPPEGMVSCQNENGKCTVGQNSFDCDCKNGGGGGDDDLGCSIDDGSGDDDTGSSSDGGGATTTTAGSTDAGEPDKTKEELMEECEALLESECQGGGDDDRGSSSDDGGATTTTTGSTDEGSTGGEVGDADTGTSDEGGDDDGAGLDGGGVDDGASDESTAGDGADATDADGTDGEAEGSSSSGCVAGPGSHSIWMLLLLSLFALVVWRRRTEINE